MNDNVRAGDIIDGKNARKAVVFAVTVCALMLLSSFSVIGSALAAGPADVVSDASVPTSPISVDKNDAQTQPSASDTAANSEIASDYAQAGDASDNTPVITDSDGNVISVDELKQMLEELKNGGSSSKGLTPTPTVTITIQGWKGMGTGKDANILAWQPIPGWYFVDGFDYQIVGSYAGMPARSLVQFDLSSLIGMGYENLLTTAELSLFEFDITGWTPLIPEVYPLTASWNEASASFYAPNDPFVNGATWTERMFGVPWVTPGSDYLPVPSSLIPVGAPLNGWYAADVRNIVSSWLDTSLPNNGVVVTDFLSEIFGLSYSAWESSELILTSNPTFAPKLTMTFKTVESHAGPIAPQYETKEFSVPYSAVTIEPSGLDYVNLYYRFSPDNGTTRPWSPWEIYQVIPGMGNSQISGTVTFNASEGKGDYQFYTEAVTVSGTVEQDPAGPDASTFYHMIGPFAPTNVVCWNNGINSNVYIKWNRSISPLVDSYMVFKADDPANFDFTSPYDIVFGGASEYYFDFGGANDLYPDYYVIRAYQSATVPDLMSNNTDYVVNRDVYIKTPPASQSYTGINFAYGNMTIASGSLWLNNSIVSFNKIKILAPGNFYMDTVDLYIEGGDFDILGDVTMSDVFLGMTGDYDGQCSINVASGATLGVSGGSSIQGLNANSLFKVAGSLTMMDSNLGYIGSHNQTSLDEAGLFISGSALLDNVLITDCVAGIISGESATSVQVTNSLITTCTMGALSYGSNALTLEDTDVTNCGGADLQDGTIPSTIFTDDMESGTGSWSYNAERIAVYSFDGESGEDGWTHGADSGPDLWHLSTSKSHSPTHSWRDASDITNNYDFGLVQNWLESPIIDLSTTTTPALSYWEWLETESFSSYDMTFVYVSDDGGATWDPLTQNGASETFWHQESWDVTSYATNQFRVLFYFDTGDGAVNGFRGWFLDDIKITDTSTPIYNWEQTTSESNSPTTSWTDSDGANYQNSMDLWLENSVDLTGADFATLDFYAMYDVGAGDAFMTQVSEDGGINWITLDSRTGTSPGYGSGTFSPYSYSLDPWVGNPNLLFRFRMVSNASMTADGVYVDDVSVSIEIPRAFIESGGIAAVSNFAGTLNSDVALINGNIMESANYAIFNDVNSIMSWDVDSSASCWNSGAPAIVTLHGDITVGGPGSNLFLQNIIGTCWNVDIASDGEMDVISSTLVTQDITVAGNLIVVATDLLLVSTFDGQWGIDVTGAMVVVAGSLVSNLVPAVAFTFTVEPGAALLFDASELSQCGVPMAVDPRDAGLYIATDNADVTNSNIHDCFVGVLADNAAIDVSSNAIHDNFIGVACNGSASSGTMIGGNNDIYYNLVGVICMSEADPLVIGNDIYWNTIGVFGQMEGNPTIVSNNIFWNEDGIDLDNVNVSANIDGNQIYENDQWGIHIIASNDLFADINNNDIYDNLYEGIYVEDAGVNTAYLNMSSNVVSGNGQDNTGSGIYVESANNLVVYAFDNDVYDSYDCGYALYAMGDIDLTVISNGIYDNDGTGLVASSGLGNITADIEDNFMQSNGDMGLCLVANGGSIVSPFITANSLGFSGNDGLNIRGEMGISDAFIASNSMQACGNNAILMTSGNGNITGMLLANSANSATADSIYIETFAGDIDVAVWGNYAFGSGSDGIAIYSAGSLIADIENNIAYSNSEYGAVLEATGTLDAFLLSNDFYDSGSSGVYIGATDDIDATLQNNNVYECSGSCIFIESGADISTLIQGNDAYSAYNGFGIYVSATGGITATVDSNDVDTAIIHGIVLAADGDIIADVTNNQAYDCGIDGIVISSSSNVDATITGNDASGAMNNGIYVYADNDVTTTVSDNDASGAISSCIIIYSGNNVTADVINNTADSSDNECGIFIHSAMDVDVSVQSNDVSGSSSAGIYVNAGNNITGDITNNTADGCYVGILVGDLPMPMTLFYPPAMNAVVSIENNTADSGLLGIIVYLQMSADVTMDGNDASSNSALGIIVAAPDVTLYVSNTTTDSNGAPGFAVQSDYVEAVFSQCDSSNNDGDGIAIMANSDANVTLIQTTAYDNNGAGVAVAAFTGSILLAVDQCAFGGNFNQGLSAMTGPGFDINATITNTEATFNGGAGIMVNAGGSITSVTMDNVTGYSNDDSGIIVVASGTLTGDLANIYCNSNTQYGLYVAAFSDVDLTVDGGQSNSNGRVGLYVQSPGSGIDLSVSSFQSAGNYENGLFVSSFGPIFAMIDSLDASGNGGLFTTYDGILMQSPSDIIVTIDNSTANDNWGDGMIVQSGSVAQVDAFNGTFTGNGESGLAISAVAVSFSVDACEMETNGWWNNGNGLTVNSGSTVYGSVNNSIMDGNDDNGMVVNAANDVGLDISYTYVGSNTVNGLYVSSGGLLDLVLDNVTADYNDEFDSYDGCGIIASASSLTATMNYVWASNCGEDGISLVSGSSMVVDGANITADDNIARGIDLAAGNYMTAALDNCEANGNSITGISIQCAYDMDVDITSSIAEDNIENGIYLNQFNWGWVIDATIDDTIVNSNGETGIVVQAPYYPILNIYDSTVINNGWNGGGDGLIVSGFYGAYDIETSSFNSNNGNGITAIAASDMNFYLLECDAAFNSGNGISASNGGWMNIDFFGPSSMSSNALNGVNILTTYYADTDIEDCDISGNGLDGVNIDCWVSWINEFYGNDISVNGGNGVHINSGNSVNAYFGENDVSWNNLNGLLLQSAWYTYFYMEDGAGDQTINYNGLDGVRATGVYVDMECTGGSQLGWNGGNGANLSAGDTVYASLTNTLIDYNSGDGLYADSSNDILVDTHSTTIQYNSGDGIDLNAPDELHLDTDWTWLVNNGGDGANLVGAYYVDVNLGATNVVSYNSGDGIEISSDYCQFSAGSGGDAYFDYNGGDGVTITTTNDPTLNINPIDVCSFSYNSGDGLSVNSGDNIDASLYSISANSNGGHGIHLVAQNFIGYNSQVTMQWIDAEDNMGDGALLESVNEDVWASVFDSTFSWNLGDGLAMIANNGDITSSVDNCNLDFNGGNGIYLYGQEVYLFPGVSVANSYSFNQEDGIHMEATEYVWLEANMLMSWFNGGNGITLIGPDGDILLDEVSCDYNTNGIFVVGGIQGSIVDSSTDYNANAGISVLGGHDLAIVTSGASYNTGVGIVLTDCDGMTIFDNYLEYNGVGIIVDNTTDTMITNNDVHYNFLDGIDVIDGSDVTLVNNIITFNFGWGIFSEPGVNIEWFADSSYNGEYAYAKMNDILLWGNITVLSNSLMTLEDLNVTIGTNQNLQRIIDIEDTGQMYLNDATISSLGGYYYYFDVYGNLDTDFATIQGAWEVRAYFDSQLNILRSNILDAGLYGIRAEWGSFVNVLDSYFSGCGFSGMYIESPWTMVSGTTFETNYRGMWLVNVGPINIEDCSFIDNERDGILVDDSLVTIPFCSFDGNGRGVRVDNLGEAFVDQCWFGNNDVGVDLLNDGYVEVMDSVFDSNAVGFYLDTFSYAWVEDCTMDSTVQEFSQRGNSMAETLNTVFSGPTYIIDSSELWVWWWYSVLVIDEVGQPIENAYVEVYENGGSFYDSGFTDADGIFGPRIILNYIKYSVGVDDSMNPYEIDASDATASGTVFVTMDHTQTVTVTLEHAPEYVPGSMSDVSFDQGDSAAFVFNLNDCFTDRGDLTFSWTSWNPKIGVTVTSDGWVSFYGTDPSWSGSGWVTFRATDEDGMYVENDILVTIDRINTAPSITSTPVTTGTQDVDYYYLVTATDPDLAYGDGLSYSLSISPSGMSIDSATGLISWTPAWNQIGINWVMVEVDDMNGGSDMQLFAINVANVNDAPWFTSSPSTTATEGTPYTDSVSADDLDLGYGDALMFSLTTAPAGMTIDPATGAITWTPTNSQVGSNLVVIKATDLGGLYDTLSVTIDVTNVNQAPTITSTPVTSATQDVQYFYQVTAADLDLPYGDTLTFSLSASPAGMTIDPATGLIAWVPSAAQVGLNWVTVTVTDSAAASASQQFAIVVANVNDAPTITSTAKITATAGVLYTYDVNATDLDLPFGDVLVFSLTTAAPGMTIDASTGLIQWMPNMHSASPVTVIVQVTDSGGLSDTQSYQITVSGINHAPSITGVTLSPTDAVAGTTINATADGWSDAESDAAQYLYQWYVNGVPVSGASGADLSGVFAKGDIVTAKITPYDGKEYGTAVESEGLIIGNTAPTLEDAAVTPISPIKTDELSVVVSGTNDVDAMDTVVCLYQWQYYNTTRNEWVNILGANSATLGLNGLKVGDKVRCIVTPFDGTATGTPVITNEVQIQEAPGAFPAAEVATIAGLAFATLFFLVLVLYIIGKIGHKAAKKKTEEPEAPKDDK